MERIRAIGKTAAETTAFNVVRIGGAALLSRYIPNMGSAGEGDELPHAGHSSLKEQVMETVKYPVLEEGAFRLAPSIATNLITGSHDTNYKVGVVTATVFAAAHNIYRDKQTGKRKFSTKTVPIPQFVGGLWYWKIQRERGYAKAVLSHALANVQIEALSFLLGKVLEKREKKSSIHD